MCLSQAINLNSGGYRCLNCHVLLFVHHFVDRSGGLSCLTFCKRGGLQFSIWYGLRIIIEGPNKVFRSFVYQLGDGCHMDNHALSSILYSVIFYSSTCINSNLTDVLKPTHCPTHPSKFQCSMEMIFLNGVCFTNS